MILESINAEIYVVVVVSYGVNHIVCEFRCFDNIICEKSKGRRREKSRKTEFNLVRN